ncbi:hypothetical protein OH76DRAFT_956059 [Lentinus brumalis]|uniref:Uncharacterized protein n=1 Tax=Lentinus brumalis TaxID=2498619 RepID=A0A371CYV0_9APHY|nr:hypothetical protein OH76DRAFT_956059 [Polyporus brumalis]
MPAPSLPRSALVLPFGIIRRSARTPSAFHLLPGSRRALCRQRLPSSRSTRPASHTEPPVWQAIPRCKRTMAISPQRRPADAAPARRSYFLIARHSQPPTQPARNTFTNSILLFPLSSGLRSSPSWLLCFTGSAACPPSISLQLLLPQRHIRLSTGAVERARPGTGFQRGREPWPIQLLAALVCPRSLTGLSRPVRRICQRHATQRLSYRTNQGRRDSRDHPLANPALIHRLSSRVAAAASTPYARCSMLASCKYGYGSSVLPYDSVASVLAAWRRLSLPGVPSTGGRNDVRDVCFRRFTGLRALFS